MKKVNTPDEATYESHVTELKSKEECKITITTNTETSMNAERITETGEKIKPGLIFKPFKGYNGKGDAFEMITDSDTGDHNIVDPKIKGGLKGVSSYKVISLFKDQFGNPELYQSGFKIIKTISI